MTMKREKRTRLIGLAIVALGSYQLLCVVEMEVSKRTLEPLVERLLHSFRRLLCCQIEHILGLHIRNVLCLTLSWKCVVYSLATTYQKRDRYNNTSDVGRISKSRQPELETRINGR